MLTFPCGAKPGFDTTHIASQNTLFTGVSEPGGGFINLLNGTVAIKNGSPTQTVDGNIGPQTNYLSSLQYNSFTNISIVTNATVATVAAIFKPTVNTTTIGYVMINLGTTANLGTISLNWALSGVLNFQFGTSSASTTFNGVLGTPYFVSFSWSSASATSNGGYVTNLATGVSIPITITGQTSAITTNGGLDIGGNVAATRNIGGGVAAVMSSNAYLPLSVHQQWASNPWSFWYPEVA